MIKSIEADRTVSVRVVFRVMAYNIKFVQYKNHCLWKVPIDVKH